MCEEKVQEMQRHAVKIECRLQVREWTCSQSVNTKEGKKRTLTITTIKT